MSSPVQTAREVQEAKAAVDAPNRQSISDVINDPTGAHCDYRYAVYAAVPVLAGVVLAIAELHVEGGGPSSSPYCTECISDTWPCRTRRLLDGQEEGT